MTTRVFVDVGPADLPADVTLDGDESHYLARVRRRQPGDGVEVLDGRGGAWAARILQADPRASVVRVETPVPSPPPVSPLHLLLGMPEPPATLEAIAAACSLGATSVTLVKCERSFHREPGPDRITRVLRAALRQCGRPAPIEVRVQPLAQALSRAEGRRFLASPQAEPGSPPALDPGGVATVLIGPEGGLTDVEEASARTEGFELLWLGPWTLETPLAAAAALARLRGPGAP